MEAKKYIAIGIDPGSSSGAIAIVIDDNLEIHSISKNTEQQIHEILRETTFKKGFNIPMVAVIEKVGAMPGQGVVSSFKFGMNYGFLRGCLVCNRISFQEYHPKKWQKYYSVSKNATESKTDWKRRLHEIAQNMYPSSKIPVYAGDSVLLANFAKSLISNK